MTKRLRFAFPLCVLVALVLTACGRAALNPPTAAAPVNSDPRLATVSELAGAVSGRSTRVDPLAPIGIGFQLQTGGLVQTGDQSRARLDFSDQSILRLASNSAYTLENVATQLDGSVTAQVQLSFGKLWVSLFGGEVQVETPVGVASVRGSFAVFQYSPGDPNDPTDDLLLVDCLEGSCSARNDKVNEQMGNLERVVLDSRSSLRQTLTQADVDAFLQDNPESDRLVATLTAAPPATATPTSATATATRTATPIPPTATFTPTFTPSPTAVSGGSGSASATPGVNIALGPTATATIAFRLIGTHTVRPSETLFCIGRGYGVLPAAIALANSAGLNDTLLPGERLRIPAIQWDGIPAGPTCALQFNSPFPGLPPSTATPTLTPIPSVTLAPLETPAPPSATPSLTPLPTVTPSPMPDQQGPSLSNFSATFVPLPGCYFDFAVDVFDASGVSDARIDWATFDANNQPSGDSGTVNLVQPRSGNTWTGSTDPQFGFYMPSGDYMRWTIVAMDTLGNITSFTNRFDATPETEACG
jgi:hypothetical protein